MTYRVGWIAHFKVDTSQIPKQGADGQYGSALFRSLKKGLVGSADYLTWAKTNYSLPVLSERFFRKPIAPELWFEVEQFHRWSNEIVPVGKWDDILYIACLQPPKEINIRQKVVFVLAPYNLIESYFRSYKNLLPEDDQVANEEDLPDGFFESEKTVTKTLSAEALDEPDEFEDDSPVDFKDHESQVTKKIHQHQFKGAQVGKSTALGSIAQQYFTKFFPKFENVLLLEPKSNKLTVTAWDSGWQPKAPPEENPVSLVDPSVFRIVARSAKAYHGYVVSNAINDSFFSMWRGSVPEHVTAVPIVAKQKVIGILLAVGKKEQVGKDHLLLAEAIAVKISQKLDGKKSAS